MQRNNRMVRGMRLTAALDIEQLSVLVAANLGLRIPRAYGAESGATHATATPRLRIPGGLPLSSPSGAENARQSDQATLPVRAVADASIFEWLRHRNRVTVQEILLDCFGTPPQRQTRAERYHVSVTLKAFGWKRRRLGPRGAREYTWLAPGSTVA